MDIKEEYRLIRLAQQNDQDAWDKLLAQHRQFFRKLAFHTVARGMEVDDLEQEAKMWFVRAVQRFDPRHGVRLSTFAYRQTWDHVYKAAQYNGLVTLPDKPTEAYRSALNPWLSIYKPAKAGSGETNVTVGDLIPDKYGGDEVLIDIDKRLLREIVRKKVGNLPARERTVIRRWLDGASYRIIGEEIGVGHSRAQQIGVRAMKRLKKSFERKRRTRAVA